MPESFELTNLLTTSELEKIAEKVHETWAAGRLAEGWTYGPRRDDLLKTHPSLVPYAELADSEKAYDRRTASATVEVLFALGYKLLK